MKKIKVLLAAYNGEKYIQKQIESILEQKDVLVDIRVADDNSKDHTIDIIKNEYPNIEVLINNPGTGSAANNFLKMVSELQEEEEFDYVAFADQDDIWLADKMNKAVEILQKDNSDLYCSNLTKWDNSNDSLTELKKDFPQKKYDFLFEGGSAGCTYVLTRKLVFHLKEFVNKHLDTSDWNEFSHDWLIYFFTRYHHYKVSIDSNSYIHYRIHDSNLHGHLNKLTFSTIKSKFSKVLEGYHDVHARNFLKYVEKDTEEYAIYKAFLGGYFDRNKMILKYNTQLMRDKKKFAIFMLLNLFRFK